MYKNIIINKKKFFWFIFLLNAKFKSDKKYTEKQTKIFMKIFVF